MGSVAARTAILFRKQREGIIHGRCSQNHQMRPLFLDKSLRISKPPEMAPGTAHFCREFFSLLQGKDWPRFAGGLQKERGEKADAGICFPVAPTEH